MAEFDKLNEITSVLWSQANAERLMAEVNWLLHLPKWTPTPEQAEEYRRNDIYLEMLHGLGAVREAALKAIETDPSLVTPEAVRWLVARVRELDEHICDY